MSTLLSTQYQSAPTVGQRLEEGESSVEVYAVASLPTRFGDFRVFVFHNSIDNKEHLALVRGDVHGATAALPVRLHSECLTGDVLGSLRCDCRDQLELSLNSLGGEGRGVLLYMRQEGRGIGLGNKIRAYTLQEEGFDTFEANAHLGFEADERDYRVAAMMLRLLGVNKIELITNNPGKVFGLRSNGIDVAGRQSVIAEDNPHNADYLATKARSGHLLPFV